MRGSRTYIKTWGAILSWTFKGTFGGKLTADPDKGRANLLLCKWEIFNNTINTKKFKETFTK